MALTPAKYIDETGVRTLATGIKTWVLSENSTLIKSVVFKDNSILFYNKPNAIADDVADFTVNLPAEYFLDQTKTVFVPNFAWSVETYPASTDPSLDGQPVLVLAVKGSDNTVTYSFISMLSLVNIYKASTDTSTVTLTINDDTNTISAVVNISSDEGNALKVGTDGGLYASATDVTSKADKLTADTLVDQILVDDGSGNLKASGITIQNIVDNMIPYTTEEVQGILDEVFNN